MISTRITEALQSFTNVHDALAKRYYAGYVFLRFKNNNYKGGSEADPAYVLNGSGDTWFRRIEGPGKGYGLAITDMRVSYTRPPTNMGNFNVYRAIVTYIPWDDEEKQEKATMHLWIHKDYELSDVMHYIYEHMHTWRP